MIPITTPSEWYFIIAKNFIAVALYAVISAFNLFGVETGIPVFYVIVMAPGEGLFLLLNWINFNPTKDKQANVR